MNDCDRKVTIYGVNTPAVYDTLFFGQIRGKVVQIVANGLGYVVGGAGAGQVVMEVTETRGAYKKGEKLSLSAHNCVPVKQLRRRKYYNTINTHYAWIA